MNSSHVSTWTTRRSDLADVLMINMSHLRTCNTSCVEHIPSNETETGDRETILPSPLIVLFSLMSLMIVAINGLVIFLIHKKKSLRTITNMFLTSLALSDLMSGLLGIPLLVICLVKDMLEVCVCSTFFFRFTAISSVCHVLLIACDRYIFIVHYMTHHSLVTKGRAIIAIISVWLLSLASSLIQLSWYIFHGIAVTEYEDITEDHNKKYSLACIVLFFAFPLLLICYIYGRIFYISCKRNKRDRQLNKNLQQPCRSLLHEWRGRSVLLITVVIFAGFWLPFFLTVLHDYMEPSEELPTPVWVQRLLVFVGFIPPILNPILCTLAKKDFRRALRELLFGRKAKHRFDQNVHFQVSSNRLTLSSVLELE